MQKQQRIMIGDIGDAFATVCADHFRREGLWATTCLQSKDELTQAIRREHPDILLLSAQAGAVGIERFVTEIRRKYDTNITVLLTSEDPGFVRALQEAGASCMLMPADFNELTELLTKQYELVQYSSREECSELDLEIEITHMLYGFGIPANLRGFHYLRRAILTAYQTAGNEGYLMADIYPAVAERFRSTEMRVERAIRHALTQAWNSLEGEPAFPFRYFPLIQNHKPTNSEFIAFAADRLKLNHPHGIRDKAE